MLTAFSLLFYAFGEPLYVFLMIGLVLADWGFGLLIDRSSSLKRKKLWLTLAVISLFLILLAENCRVPFDDPETHLELTMIHEAMILDNSGPDLAAIHYAAALKLWVFISFLATLILPNLIGSAVWEFVIYYG